MNSSDFRYQWFLNNKIVGGQGTSALSIRSVTEGNTGDYTCSVQNPYGGIGRSNKIVLALGTLVMITTLYG